MKPAPRFASIPSVPLVSPVLSPNPLQRAVRMLLVLLAWSAFIWPSLTFAQSTQYSQYTKNTPDQTLRGDARVDPATHALSIEIPLAAYPGRAGLNFPITINYSSKVWRIDAPDEIDGVPGGPYFEYPALSSERSAAGWTSSLNPPTIEYTYANEGYDNYTGQPGGTQGNINQIARIHVRMPDGSSHELRKDDLPHNSQDTSYSYTTGSYYAVDGSRLRYDIASMTLFLPDGSRYTFAPPPPSEAGNNAQATQYIDRSGNTLSYNATNHQWADTLGRSFSLPLPLPPIANTTMIPGEVQYTLPGVNGTLLTYRFRWKLLKDPQTGASVLTDPTQPLNYPGDFNCGTIPFVRQSPSLFQSNSRNAICAGQTFNPVVLSERVLEAYFMRGEQA